MGKKVKIFSSVLGLIAMLSIGYITYINKDWIFKIEGGEEIVNFDHSTPGRWTSITKEYDISGEEEKLTYTNTINICITKEMIEEAKYKPLKEKLGFSTLDCSVKAKRLSYENANFQISCTGMGQNNTYIGLSMEGKIENKKEMSQLEKIIKLQEGNNAPIIFKRKINNERIGDCEEEK